MNLRCAWASVAVLASALGGCVRGHGLGAPSSPAVAAVAPPAHPAAVEPTPHGHARRRAELPLGGREIFPRYRLVGFCGTPGAPALGRLTGRLAQRAQEAVSYGQRYAADRQVLPVFELIAVVVQGVPGGDGLFRRRVPDSVVDAYLETARAAHGLLLLNIQPGHSDFMTEVKHFERYLREPDVGIALDPEWGMKPKQAPGVFYGQTTGQVIDEVASYLSGIVQHDDLPEKALVFHQMNAYVVKDEGAVRPYPGIAVVKSVDGLGPKAPKITTYDFLLKSIAPGVHPGFKLFFDEDTSRGGRLMTPAEVLALSPAPEYVMYE